MNQAKQTISIRQLMSASGVGFGTSGVRGLVADMTPALCFSYALAFIQSLALPSGGRVAIGMDLRPSSPDIARACAAAVRYAGHEAEFCGALPTPALACYAQAQGIAAIMVTGSHIPFDRNGIKFYGLAGEITKADEADISDAQVSIPGRLELGALPELNPAARQSYIDRYLGFFPASCLQGLRLGVYEHSSVARDLLRTILESLGAEVISLGRTDEFVPIDTEAVSDADIRMARRWAEEVGFDAILSTDGDADRPLIGDESGNWLRGDIVGILCARYLGVAAVATPVSSNTALEACGDFQAIARTRIGSPYVIEGMASLIEAGWAVVAGFEANGGFLLGSAIDRSGRHIDPLMTRDAVLPMLALLAMAAAQGVPLSRLPQQLPSRFTGSSRLQSFPSETSRRIIRQLAGSRAEIGILLGPVCGEPVAQDETDGLRVTFANGEIVHFRPSGNAPELRCYAEAASQDRADLLSRQSLQRLQEAYGQQSV